MLTKADEFPIHQTPEPIAFSGTDRNFYDRFFFNAYNPDGSVFIGAAFGVYPHLNIADAHVAVVLDGVEHCIHASRVLHMERWDLEVGPIRIEVLEPLKRIRLTLAQTDGISAELVFEGRAFPIEEPRFVRRAGPRTLMDYTRMTQNGHYSGWVEVDGKRVALAPGASGTRDRSWGIRGIGAGDPQPVVPAQPGGFFWQWTPLNFDDRSVFFHVNADPDGTVWNTRAVVAMDGAGAKDLIESDHATMETVLQPGLRHAKSGVLSIPLPGQPPVSISFEPIARFQMRGIGYMHAKWGHGRYLGELVVEREDFGLANLDLNAFENLHIQALSKVVLTQDGQPAREGRGVFEQLIIGPYAPLGLG